MDDKRRAAEQPGGRDEAIEPRRIQELRAKLAQDSYMDAAVQRIAQELTLELMENTYGVSFR